nr:hypothetical protein [Tanacetum cinerariifolium]
MRGEIVTVRRLSHENGSDECKLVVMWVVTVVTAKVVLGGGGVRRSGLRRGWCWFRLMMMATVEMNVVLHVDCGWRPTDRMAGGGGGDDDEVGMVR